MHFCRKLIEKNNGFTLIEIIVTIIVLGTLMSIAIPRYSNVLERTKAGEGAQILTTLLAAQKLYEFENGSLSSDPDDLEIAPADLNPKHFDPPNLNNNITQVATITRDMSNPYTLSINYNGVLSCSGNVAVCQNLGY